MKEREIDLMDLIIEVLLHWRGIILTLLIGGVLLGGFGFIKSSQASKAHSTRLQELESRREELKEQQAIPASSVSLANAIQRLLADDEYNLEAVAQVSSDSDIAESIEALRTGLEEKLTEIQLNDVNYALYYEKLYDEKIDYQEHSILMQMNPDSYYQGETTFLIVSDDVERTYNLEQVYEDAVYSSDLLEKLAAQADVPAAYVSEIYSPVRDSEKNLNGRETFKVTVAHYDEAMCQMLLQTVIDHVEAMHEEMELTWASHEVTVLSRNMGTISSKSILDAQNAVWNSILSLKDSIADIKSTFTYRQWYYYNLLNTGEIIGNPYTKPPYKEDASRAALAASIAEVEAAIKEESEVVTGGGMRQALVGAVIAAFLYVFVLFMIYVLNNKLRATDRLGELYDIPQLGMIPHEENKEKPLSFVDKWILSLRYRNQHKFSGNEALELAAAAVKIEARKNSLDTIYLIGGSFKGHAMTDHQQISDILTEDGITVHMLNNVLYDAETMEKLNNAQGAVLIEKAGSALYTEIARELELLKRQGIKILGGIVIE